MEAKEWKQKNRKENTSKEHKGSSRVINTRFYIVSSN